MSNELKLAVELYVLIVFHPQYLNFYFSNYPET